MCMCCKDDPVTPEYPPDITHTSHLDGHWGFVSFDYPNVGVYTPSVDCGTLPVEMTGRPLLLSFTFDGSAETVTVTDECTGTYLTDAPYVLASGNINITAGMGLTLSYFVQDYEDGVLTLTKYEGPSGSSTHTTLTVQKE